MVGFLPLRNASQPMDKDKEDPVNFVSVDEERRFRDALKRCYPMVTANVELIDSLAGSEFFS